MDETEQLQLIARTRAATRSRVWRCRLTFPTNPSIEHEELDPDDGDAESTWRRRWAQTDEWRLLLSCAQDRQLVARAAIVTTCATPSRPSLLHALFVFFPRPRVEHTFVERCWRATGRPSMARSGRSGQRRAKNGTWSSRQANSLAAHGLRKRGQPPSRAVTRSTPSHGSATEEVGSLRPGALKAILAERGVSLPSGALEKQELVQLVLDSGGVPPNLPKEGGCASSSGALTTRAAKSEPRTESEGRDYLHSYLDALRAEPPKALRARLEQTYRDHNIPKPQDDDGKGNAMNAIGKWLSSQNTNAGVVDGKGDSNAWVACGAARAGGARGHARCDSKCASRPHHEH